MKSRKEKDEELDLRDQKIVIENHEYAVKARNTRRAIEDTYGPDQPTKFRRKLYNRNGKRRHWKDKKAIYATLEGEMSRQLFNRRGDTQRAIQGLRERALKRFKKSQKLVLPG